MSVRYNTEIVKSGLVILFDPANSRLRSANGSTFYNGVSNTFIASSYLQYGNNAYGYLQSDGTLFLDGNESESSNNGNFLIASGDLSSGMSNADFSTSCWVYITENKRVTIAEYRGASFRLDFSANSTTMAFSQRNMSSPFSTTVTQVNVTNVANTWYNFVLTRSDTDMFFYRNGELIGSNTIFQQTEGFGVGSAISIGYSYTDDYYPSRAMSGYLGHWSHYNKELTQEEVKINFNALRKRYGV